MSVGVMATLEMMAHSEQVVRRVRLLLSVFALLLLATGFAVANGAIEPKSLLPVFVLTALGCAYGAHALHSTTADRSVPAGIVLKIAAAIDREAMRTGAVRQIDDVSAHLLDAKAIEVHVALTFKDGVSAQHAGPILARLRTAAQVEVAEVTDVLMSAGNGHPGDA
jgi:hypothetical protein